MASIPLASLALRPPEPVDTLGQYARIVALKQAQQQMQYQQQMQPLQLQQEQQSLQIQHQQLVDQQAFHDAYSTWDGKDYDTLAGAVGKNGGSFQVVNGIRMAGLNQQKELSEILKNQGEAGKAHVQTLIDNNTIANQKISSLTGDDPQAVASMAQEGLNAGWLDQQHAQALMKISQLPGDQMKATLPQFAKPFLSNAAQAELALKQTQQQTAAAEFPGKQAVSAEQVAKQQELAQSGLTPSAFEAKTAGAKKAAEEAAAFPYQSRLVAVRQQVENQFWNNKDAIGKVESNVIKPFSDQMQAVQQLKDAVDLAEQGNITAARAVVPKLVGISQPIGSKRYNQKEAEQLASQGSVPQRFVGLVQNLAMGNPWTPQMSSDMRELANSVQATAVNSANAQIDNINTLHKTSIGHVDAPKSSAATPSSGGGIAPEGTVIRMPDGSHQVKQGGKWVAQP